MPTNRACETCEWCYVHKNADGTFYMECCAEPIRLVRNEPQPGAITEYFGWPPSEAAGLALLTERALEKVAGLEVLAFEQWADPADSTRTILHNNGVLGDLREASVHLAIALRLLEGATDE